MELALQFQQSISFVSENGSLLGCFMLQKWTIHRGIRRKSGSPSRTTQVEEAGSMVCPVLVKVQLLWTFDDREMGSSLKYLQEWLSTVACSCFSTLYLLSKSINTNGVTYLQSHCTCPFALLSHHILLTFSSIHYPLHVFPKPCIFCISYQQSFLSSLFFFFFIIFACQSLTNVLLFFHRYQASTETCYIFL